MDALIGILGTVLGFVLSELATRLREAQQDRKEASAVRALLRLEINLNLDLIRALWAQINPNDTHPDHETNKRYFAEQVISTPAPPFTREAYSSQLPKLSAALDEKQVVQVFEFYQRLESLTALRSQLAAWHDTEQASRQAGGLPVPGKPPPIISTPFNSQAPDAWDAYEKVVRTSLEKGNPLGGAVR